MSAWDSYPPDYRAAEVRAITGATRAGECVSVVGLSGAGKSNLLGFLADRHSTAEHAFAHVDCNRLQQPELAALFRLIRRTLAEADSPPLSRPSTSASTGSASAQEAATGEGLGVGVADELDALDAAIERRLKDAGSSLSLALDVSLLFSRFDDLARDPAFSGNLRSLRDAHKYRLTFVTATRHLLPPHTELSELFYAHTLWLGPLSESDARWNVARYAERKGLKWDDAISQSLISASRGYPSLLRAVCESARRRGQPGREQPLGASSGAGARRRILGGQPRRGRTAPLRAGKPASARGRPPPEGDLRHSHVRHFSSHRERESCSTTSSLILIRCAKRMI